MNLIEKLLAPDVPGDRVAFRSSCDDRSYDDVRRRVGSLARAFRNQGVEVGDRIAIILDNRIEYIEAYLAILSVGAIAVLINRHLAAAEKLQQLDDAKIIAIVLDNDEKALLEAARRRLGREIVALVLGSSGDGSYEAAAAGPGKLEVIKVAPDHVAMIVYTSGTTSGPKGVMLTHDNIIANIEQYLAYVDLPVGNLNLQLSPMYHAAIFFVLLHLSLSGTTVFVRDVRPEEILSSIERYKINFIFLVPTVLYKILDYRDRDKHDVSSIRILQYGAAPITMARLIEARRVFGPKLIHSYGMTESTSHVSILLNQDHDRALGSVGRPLPEVEVRIVGESGSPVTSGEIGELQFIGRNISPGYWRQPDETAASRLGKWFCSGDLGYFDSDGMLYVSGRKKDLIISGGVNIYPKDIEEALSSHPDIADVVVFGVPHPHWGEAVAAAVTLRSSGNRPTPDDLKCYCRSRLPGFKVPKIIEVLQEMPKTATGKIAKREMQRMFIESTDG